MIVQSSIENKLSSLEPQHLEVVNESNNHHVPDNSETHFKVTIVASQFDDMTRIDRHRLINELLQSELKGPVHALAIHAYTDLEWKRRFGEAPMSPPCLGGGSIDRS